MNSNNFYQNSNNNNNLSLSNINQNNCFSIMNNNYISQQNYNKIYYIKKPIYPHKTGLLNIGQTCYMNASIQCISNIEKLSNFLLSRFGTFNINTQQLTFSFTNLLFELFYPNKKYISPNIFKSVIGELNPLFEGNQASDAKDLVFFIIERLHQELKPPVNIINSNYQIDFAQQEIESQNENLTLQKFLIDFALKNTSIVSDTFYGITRSTMKCYGCNIVKYSYQTFNLLNFVLKKVKDDKIAKIGEYYDGIDLYDAFDSDKKEEILKDENMIYCNICKGLKNGSHQQSIYGLPSVLIIILNRGKNNEDFNEEFKFYETLDFTGSNYIINQNSYHKYYLCGIITHLGESGTGGHFIAYCRNNVNDNFFCYNDASISEVKIKDAMSTKISQKDCEKKTPYVLFYNHY